MIALYRDFTRKRHQIGLLPALWHCVGWVGRRVRSFMNRRVDPFDARYGTDTAAIVSVGALGIPGDKLAVSERYEPVSEGKFDSIMKLVGADDLRFYQFVDLGSGKGRALMLASFYPFADIVGWELCPMLHRITTENLAKFLKRFDHHPEWITCVNRDATEFAPEMDTVLFLNNPFPEPIMQRVVESVSRCKFDVWVVYVNPQARKCWDESKAFRLVNSLNGSLVYQKV